MSWFMRRHGKLATLVSLTAASLLLSGCGAGKPLTVSYTFDDWLADDYANGVGEVWEAHGLPIATSADRSKVLITESTRIYHGPDEIVKTLAAVVDVKTGTTIAELDGIACGKTNSPSINGVTLCVEDPEQHREGQTLDDSGPRHIVTYDINTGELKPLIESPADLIGMRVVSKGGDGTWYVALTHESSTQLYAFSESGQQLWSVSVSEEPSRCALIDKRLACEFANGPIQTFDVATGAALETLDHYVSPMWTTEGYLEGTGTELILHAWDGSTKKVGGFPWIFEPEFLKEHQGMVLDYGQLKAAKGVQEIDRDGNVVLREKGNFYFHHQAFPQSGHKAETAKSRVGTANGKTFWNTVDGQIVDDQDNRIDTAAPGLLVFDGIFVKVNFDKPNQIYPPK